jgi:hypothetical protein
MKIMLFKLLERSRELYKSEGFLFNILIYFVLFNMENMEWNVANNGENKKIKKDEKREDCILFQLIIFIRSLTFL